MAEEWSELSRCFAVDEEPEQDMWGARGTGASRGGMFRNRVPGEKSEPEKQMKARSHNFLTWFPRQSVLMLGTALSASKVGTLVWLALLEAFGNQGPFRILCLRSD